MILQLQKTYGNRAVGQLLQATGRTPGVAQMVRKDYSSTGAPRNGAAFHMQNHPQYGDWHFHFIKDAKSNTVERFFVTLEEYKGKKRHVMFDGPAQTASSRLGQDLGRDEAREIVEWAEGLLTTQLAGAVDVNEEEYQRQVQKFNEDQQKSQERAAKIQEEQKEKEQAQIRQSGSELAVYLLDQKIKHPEAYIRTAFRLKKEAQWMSDLTPEQIEALRELI